MRAFSFEALQAGRSRFASHTGWNCVRTVRSICATMAALSVALAAGCNGPIPSNDSATSSGAEGITRPATPPSAAAIRPARTQAPDPAETAKRAWQSADSAHSEAAYRDFAQSFPHDTHAATARSIAARLSWQHAERAWDRGDSSGYRQYLDSYPSGDHAHEAKRMLEGVHVSLASAVSRGWVRPHVEGAGLAHVSVTLKRVCRTPLHVAIPAGTLFVAAGDAQNMVATEDEEVDLASSRTAEVSAPAACVNFDKPEPEQSNRFSVLAQHPDPLMRRLLPVIARESPSSTVRQIAIWSISDNPTRDEVDGHLRITNMMTGESRSPTRDEYRSAAHLLRQAGIKPSSRRAFQSRM